MNMMNNLLMMLMGLMRSGGNPMALLQQMAENVAKEKGVSINDVARQLGLDLPSNR